MLLAKRPKYMCMDVRKFERSFNQKTRACFKEIDFAIKYKKKILFNCFKIISGCQTF